MEEWGLYQRESTVPMRGTCEGQFSRTILRSCAQNLREIRGGMNASAPPGRKRRRDSISASAGAGGKVIDSTRRRNRRWRRHCGVEGECD